MRGHDEGAERRGEGERVHERDTHGNGHRQTELSVECTCGSAHEAYRDEHGHEHESSGYERCGDAPHGVYGRFVCGFISLVEFRLHGLYHDDRVVHHRSNHQHERKEGNHVEAESGHKKECKGSHKRHDDRDCRDNGRTETLKEHEYHEDHKEYRLEEGLDDIVDRRVKEVLGAHQVHDIQSLRQVAPDPLHLCIYRFDDLVRIGTGCLRYADCRSWMTVHQTHVVVTHLSEFYGGYVLEPQHCTVAFRADDHVLVIGHVLVTSAILQHVAESVF